MQSFTNALLFEPLSFCSFACFRQVTDFAALCSSCWVGLTFCATRSNFDVASDELCARLVVPPALGRLRRYSLMQKGVACRFLPEEISNFATTVAWPKLNL